MVSKTDHSPGTDARDAEGRGWKRFLPTDFPQNPPLAVEILGWSGRSATAVWTTRR